MKKARLILAAALMVVLFSSCIRDHDYLYCDNTTVTVVNSSRYVIYYSWTSSYCERYDYIMPGEKLIYSLGSGRLDLDNPEVVTFDYRYGGYGYSDGSVDVTVDDCSKIIYID